VKRPYETLDEYLDELDKIKERVAEESRGMDIEQTKAYFARAHQELEKVTGKKLRVRRTGRKLPTTRP
jgi:hypothetical protein